MRRRPVLRVTSKLLIPPILLYGLYVQFHGDFGPGGGFQAGVIFAAAFILYALLFGVGVTRRVAPATLMRIGLAAGVLIFAGVGVVTMLLGGEYLNYSVLAHDPAHGQHLGILLVEFGVGVTVAASMITIFLVYAGRDLHPEDD